MYWVMTRMNESWHIYISYVFIKTRRATHSVVVRRDLSHIMSKGGACERFCENRVVEVVLGEGGLHTSRCQPVGLPCKFRRTPARVIRTYFYVKICRTYFYVKTHIFTLKFVRMTLAGVLRNLPSHRMTQMSHPYNFYESSVHIFHIFLWVIRTCFSFTESSDDSSHPMTHLHIKICADDSRRSPAKITRESYRLVTASVETPFTKPNHCHSILWLEWVIRTYFSLSAQILENDIGQPPDDGEAVVECGEELSWLCHNFTTILTLTSSLPLETTGVDVFFQNSNFLFLKCRLGIITSSE